MKGPVFEARLSLFKEIADLSFKNEAMNAEKTALLGFKSRYEKIAPNLSKVKSGTMTIDNLIDLLKKSK